MDRTCTCSYLATHKKACFPQRNSIENLWKQTVQEEIRNFMGKKQDESVESTCSSSSNIKDDLPKANDVGRNII